jgi:MFS family permease
MTFLIITTSRGSHLSKRMAIVAVAAMIGVMFAGSTLLTPLYIMYKQTFGFSGITLTLIYAAYVVGNLGALLFLGRVSDQIGRRRAALPALAVAALSTLVFLFADGTAALFVGRVLSGLGIGVAVGTGNAWLAEFVGKDKARATVISTGTNFVGLGLGPLLSGFLAQYAPWPLHLSFVVYLACVAVVAMMIWRTAETVAPGHRVDAVGDVSLRPRLGVPRAIRGRFVSPAVAGFGAMAMFGFFAALAPSVLAQELHVGNHAVAGGIVFELAMVGAAAIVLTRALPSRTVMMWGLALLVPSVAALVAAQFAASLALMVAATALCGVTAALGYRGSLQVVNQIAPGDRRAEVVSSYFVCCFIGNSVPVIGVGVISAYSSMPVASAGFAAVLIIFAVVAFVFEARRAG